MFLCLQENRLHNKRTNNIAFLFIEWDQNDIQK
jgi:hypothetical protein